MSRAVIGDSIGMTVGGIAGQQILPRVVPVGVRGGGTAYVLREDIAACRLDILHPALIIKTTIPYLILYQHYNSSLQNTHEQHIENTLLPVFRILYLLNVYC